MVQDICQGSFLRIRSQAICLKDYPFSIELPCLNRIVEGIGYSWPLVSSTNLCVFPLGMLCHILLECLFLNPAAS